MSAEKTVEQIVEATSWDQRVARIRQVPQRHGTDEHARIYAAVAKQLYVPHLAPDFAYVHEAEFYELPHFEAAYRIAAARTDGFVAVSADDLALVLKEHPTTLLIFRTILGLTKKEFAECTRLVAEPRDLSPLSDAKVDSMEKRGTSITPTQASVAALTIEQIMAGTLFGDPAGGLKSKQQKPDTVQGWLTVQELCVHGVPYGIFLHQRHSGGAFRQVLDATSTLRGNLIEDAVEDLFRSRGLLYLRTGAHNQAEIEERFEVAVRPAPDFVVHDDTGTLRAMLECKGANDGGTARDKALRFDRLREEANRLGGIPLVAVVAGLGWARVNDTLGPVVRDCDGRVFTIATLPEMLTVQPFPALAAI